MIWLGWPAAAVRLELDALVVSVIMRDRGFLVLAKSFHQRGLALGKRARRRHGAAAQADELAVDAADHAFERIAAG